MALLGTQQMAQVWPVFAAQGALSPAVYTRRGPSTVNYTTGAITTPTSVADVRVLLGTYRAREIDGVRIVQGDRPVLLPQASLSALPRMGDTFTISGEVWTVMDAGDSGNGGLWKFQCRRLQGPTLSGPGA